MKASQLRDELDRMIAEHGDWPVTIYDVDSISYDTVYGVQVRADQADTFELVAN